MGHEISMVGGKANAVFNAPAWHGLGTVFNRLFTIEEAITEAKLDYIVKKVDLSFKRDDEKFGLYTDIPSRKALIREDTNDFFAIVSNIYKPFQNYEAFNFLESLISDNKLVIDSAGALYNGQYVFISAKLPGSFQGPIKDEINKYFLIVVNHDGKSSTRIGYTPVRVVCKNTLTMALKNNKTIISIRHSNNYKERLEQAKKVLKLQDLATEYAKDAFNYMFKEKVSDEQAAKLFCHIFDFPTQDKDNSKEEKEYLLSTKAANIYKDVMGFYQEGLGQENIVGNLYGVYNAVSGYFHHTKQYKTREERAKDILDGNAFKKIVNSFNILLDDKEKQIAYNLW